jgi:flavodoxin
VTTNILVVYDTAFGNTERIAAAIAGGLGPDANVTVSNVGESPAIDPTTFDLLIVGGPTQRHGASPGLLAWLHGLGTGVLDEVPAAAFDTRYRGPTFLSGSAARTAARELRRAGCRLVVPEESFFVVRDERQDGEERRHSREELESGEIERAAAWAASLLPIATGPRGGDLAPP